MFRYGGPIKEGVMSGIREPKRNGGSMMGNDEGPRRAALVGNPIYPQVDGRTNHIVPAVIGAGLAMPFIGAGIRAAARPFGQFVMRQVPKLIKSGKNKGQPLLDKKGIQQFYKSSTKNPAVQGFDTNPVGGFFARDPVVSTGGKVISGLLSPTTGGYIQKAARFVVSPTGIATGLIYSNGKFFNKKGEEAPPPPEGSTLGDTVDIKGGGADTEAVRRSPEEIKAAEAKARMEKMESYKEIMDIKGMSKDAAYKSLIDASQIIADNGNLKEGIKDGSLIARLSGAASKRFDKVGDTEAALRSLVAKGEIENEMNKETKALDREYKQSALDINKKKLAGATLAEELSAYRTKNDKNASGRKLAGFLMDKNVNVIDIADTVKVDEHIKSGGDAVSFMESIVLKNLEKGTQVTPGIYVVKDAIIQIDENGNVTRARP